MPLAASSTSPRRPAAASVTFGPYQPSSMACSRVRTQAWSPSSDAAASASARARPERACSQRNRPSPLCMATWVSTSLGSSITSSPVSTWPWSAVRASAVPAGQHLEQRGDEVVDPAELLVVLRAEAVLVAHLVEALVVRVHERLAGAA